MPTQRTKRQRLFRAGIPAVAVALLLLTYALIPWYRHRQSGDAPETERSLGASLVATAAVVPQDLNGLTAGTDYRLGTLLLLFREESEVDTTAEVQSALASMAAEDPVIAAMEVQDVVPVFDTAPGVLNRDRKLVLGMDRHFRLQLPSTTDLVALIDALADEVVVETAQVEAILSPTVVPDDPYYNRSPLPEDDWQWNHQNLHSEVAWDVAQGNADVIIATIDNDGFAFGHPDLVGNPWQNTGEDFDQDGVVIEEVGGVWQYDAGDVNGVDDDANGFVDDFIGWDFDDGPDGSNDVSPEPGDGAHGMLVAGTAGARGNNGAGVAGVCWTCSLMYVQPGDDWAPAIVYAADNGADVIVLSWAGISDEVSHQAIQYAIESGTVFISGTGNNRTTITYPGAFDETLAVAGTWSNDARAGDPNNPAAGSAWGTKADIAAPWSTWSTNISDGYQFTAGTSISGPMVAGAIGLLKAKEPTLRRSNPGTISDATLVATIRSAIQGSIDSIYVPSGTPARYIGTGRLNIEELLGRSGYPVALLDPSLDDQMVSQTSQLQIRGTAAGDFESYTVAYGSGVYPATWTEIASSTTPVTNDTLATLYASSLPEPGDYTIRLAVRDAAGDLALDDTIIHYGPFMDLATTGEIWTSPVFADLDSDGLTKEIIVGDYNGKVYAWHADGTVVSGWPQSTSFGLLSSPTVTNADADPFQEVLIGGRNGKLYAWDANGTPLPGWPKTLTGSPTASTPAVGDVDGDGYPEIFIGTSITTPAGGYLYGFNHDGSAILALTRMLEGQVDTSPAIGDVDGDGQLEVIVAAGDPLPTVHVFNADGSEPAGWPVSFGIPKSGSPVLGNLDADAAMEVIIGQRGDYGDGEVRAYDNNGTLLWSTPTGGPLSLSPALADVDNDGALDIVVGNSASTVTVLDHTGTPLPGWPQTTSGTIHFSSPAVADVDNDGRNEIAIGIFTPNRPFILFEDNGATVPGWPVNTRSATGGGIGSSPAIGDLTNDGKIELAVGTTSYVRVWTLSAPLNAAKTEWPLYRHDAQRTGLYGKSCTVTLNGQCAALQKPLLCSNGLMVPTCGLCGCPGGQPQCLPSGYCSQESQCRPSCEFE